jgi:hypothetical protein
VSGPLFAEGLYLIKLQDYGQGKRLNRELVDPPKREDLRLATHPSDHNSMFTAGSSDSQWSRNVRIKRRKDLRARDWKRVQEGELDEEVYKRGETHTSAFLSPLCV